MSNTQKYIVWFFKLLISFVILSLILLFTVRINDKVIFRKGEIISSSPQIDLKAPYEAQLSKVYVYEGQKVNAGDTLMTIYNEANSSECLKQKSEREFLEKKLLSVQSSLRDLDRKKNQIDLETKVNTSDYNLDVQSIQNNNQTLEEQYKLQLQKLNLALERNRADSILYHKDMLSKIEYNSGKDATHEIRSSINTIKNELKKQKTQQNVSANSLERKQYEHSLKTLELEENHQHLQQMQIDLHDQLNKANQNFELLQHELAKQYFKATTRGTVNFIYNLKQASNIINKGELLISISPDKKEFYARVQLPENNIQYVKPAMPAHIELDAYYRLKFGIIQGSVNYISERKENEKFYALIKLGNTNNFQLKSGYNISGEIITGRLLLFQYFLKKLFKEFDKV